MSVQLVWPLLSCIAQVVWNKPRGLHDRNSINHLASPRAGKGMQVVWNKPRLPACMGFAVGWHAFECCAVAC